MNDLAVVSWWEKSMHDKGRARETSSMCNVKRLWRTHPTSFSYCFATFRAYNSSLDNWSFDGLKLILCVCVCVCLCLFFSGGRGHGAGECHVCHLGGETVGSQTLWNFPHGSPGAVCPSRFTVDITYNVRLPACTCCMSRYSSANPHSHPHTMSNDKVGVIKSNVGPYDIIIRRLEILLMIGWSWFNRLGLFLCVLPVSLLINNVISDWCLVEIN